MSPLETLGQILIEFGAQLPARSAQFVRILSFLDYLPLVDNEEQILGIIQDDAENWSNFVGYTSREDLERVLIPGLCRALRAYAISKDHKDLQSAIFELRTYTIREMIREGQAPVLCQVQNLPSEVSQEGPFRGIGGVIEDLQQVC